MAMCYKRLWKLLIDRDMTRADLRKVTGISPATIAKMSKGEPIGAGIFERICEALHCNIGDIADYVPEGMSKRKSSPAVSNPQPHINSSYKVRR